MSNNTEDRIRLCKAMGWGGFYVGDITGKDFGIPPNERGLSGKVVPDPFTNADDDYAVLVWLRIDSDIDSEAYAIAMLTLIEEQGGDPRNSFPMYRVGNYARAALKVLQ